MSAVTSPFSYELPKERIAQRPVGPDAERSNAKLLRAVFGESGLVKIEDTVFSELPSLLLPGDLLVVNDSKVVPCRFFGKKQGEDGEFQIFLLERVPNGEEEVWHAFAKPLRKLEVNDRLTLSPHLEAQVVERHADKRRVLLRLLVSRGSTLEAVMEREGITPIPPYIRGGHSDAADRESYQTVFARHPGSLAAPTAGLHFTRPLLNELSGRGVEIAEVTLHIGPASFLSLDEPVAADLLVERFSIPNLARERILLAKAEGRRVVAVGTTSVRALESAGTDADFWSGPRARWSDDLRETSLIIRPGHQFSLVDALITNFHQPGSSHLSLVTALAGEGVLSELYAHALRNGYRFLSYGDALFFDLFRSRVYSQTRGAASNGVGTASGDT